MAAYETGYDDERFQYPVGQSFHCSICLNVFKDPVKCRRNEHLFCRSCITEHLKNHQSCPSCKESLTVDMLSQAPRTVTNLLAELKIRCDFFERGCGKFIELGNLESHLSNCGFAPAVCSNEGCQLEVNKQDLLHHETAVCEQRRVQCHSCNDIRQEMEIMKVNLAAMNEKFDRNEKTFERIEMKVEAVEENVVTTIQQQLNNHEVVIRQVQGDVVEMKETLNTISKQLEKMTQGTWHEVPIEQKHITSALESATAGSKASDSPTADSNASDSYISYVDSNASDSATEDSDAVKLATVKAPYWYLGTVKAHYPYSTTVNANAKYSASAIDADNAPHSATVNAHNPYSAAVNAYNWNSATVQDPSSVEEKRKGKKSSKKIKKEKRKNKNKSS